MTTIEQQPELAVCWLDDKSTEAIRAASKRTGLRSDEIINRALWTYHRRGWIEHLAMILALGLVGGGMLFFLGIVIWKAW